MDRRGEDPQADEGQQVRVLFLRHELRGLDGREDEGDEGDGSEGQPVGLGRNSKPHFTQTLIPGTSVITWAVRQRGHSTVSCAPLIVPLCSDLTLLMASL